MVQFLHIKTAVQYGDFIVSIHFSELIDQQRCVESAGHFLREHVEIKREVDDMLREGRIEPQTSSLKAHFQLMVR